jgi:hypothetical protein
MFLVALLFATSSSPIAAPAPCGLFELLNRESAPLSAQPQTGPQNQPQDGSEKETRNQGPEDTRNLKGDSEVSDLPPGVVARIGDKVITLEEYKEELFRLNAYGPLGDMIHRRLLDAEARRLQLKVTEDQLEAAWTQEWAMMLARSHGNTDEVMSNLDSLGYTKERYQAQYFIGQLATMQENLIIKKLRIPTEEQLRTQFDFAYGLDGEKVVLRHLMLNRSRTKSALQAKGTPPELLTNMHLDRAMDAKAKELMIRVAEGEEFDTLCRAESHDLSVNQNAGVIPGYNFKHYGEAIASAVHAASIGEVVGPVTGASGLHLLKVESRVMTKFEDVRELLFVELKAKEASYAERAALTGRLFRETKVERR